MLNHTHFPFVAGLAICLVVIALSPAFSAADQGERPNVIVILTDDQGYGDVGCHGNPYVKTPNLDKLYRQSARFTDFHVDPMCAPTRAALMTGRYSMRTGVWSTLTGCYIPAASEVTMGHVFSEGGYATGMFGKWHLGDTYPYAAEHRGFEHVVRHGAGVVGEVPDYWNNDYFDDTYFKNGVPTKVTGHCSEVWVNETMEFIKSINDQPYFCYLAFNAPHGPLNVHSDYSDPYVKAGVPEKRARFYGLITHLDEQVGRLTDWLDDTGQADNTIVVFMGDNGTAGGVSKGRDGICKPVSPANGYNAGMRDTKTSPYEGGHRNSCFVRWPAAVAGDRDIEGLAAHIDLMPTLVELCGLKKPNVQLDGVSLAAQLKGKRENCLDRTLVVHNMQLVKPMKYKDFAVLTNKWRFVKTQKWNQPKPELFDIANDPGQTNDVTSEHPEVADRMMAEYEKWWSGMEGILSHVSPAVVGSDQENPVLLTCHSWKTPSKLMSYNQSHVREGVLINDAYWPIEVAEDGEYEIELRRWPKEADTPITTGLPGIKEPFTKARPGGEALAITQARLKVQGVDQSVPVTSTDKGAKFTLQLKQGQTELRAWFTFDKTETFNAYYVYVEKR